AARGRRCRSFAASAIGRARRHRQRLLRVRLAALADAAERLQLAIAAGVLAILWIHARLAGDELAPERIELRAPGSEGAVPVAQRPRQRLRLHLANAGQQAIVPRDARESHLARLDLSERGTLD